MALEGKKERGIYWLLIISACLSVLLLVGIYFVFEQRITGNQIASGGLEIVGDNTLSEKATFTSPESPTSPYTKTTTSIDSTLSTRTATKKTVSKTATISSMLSSCTDSDGGISALLKGTVTSSGTSATDYCLDKMKLKEHYCSGGTMVSMDLDCSIGANHCENGACVLGSTGGDISANHTECVAINNSFACQVVSGIGENKCKVDADCLNLTQPTHFACMNTSATNNALMCQRVNGIGANECSTNQDCVNRTGARHSECRETNGEPFCVSIEGEGEDECGSNEGCPSKMECYGAEEGEGRCLECTDLVCYDNEEAGSCVSDLDCISEGGDNEQDREENNVRAGEDNDNSNQDNGNTSGGGRRNLTGGGNNRNEEEPQTSPTEGNERESWFMRILRFFARLIGFRG